MRNLYGLEKVVEETNNFDRIVKGVYEKTAEEIFGCKNPKGIAVFAYGSPGRIELVGGDSDADVLLVEKERNTNTMRFRKILKENLSFFDFCKVDLTEWGNYSELDVFLKKSLVEGNQILEARYLIGDEEINKDLEEKKKDFDTLERQLENFFFNRLYFNQYFRQRIRNNSLNVKYCHGGSRDFLFFYWYDKFNQSLYGAYPNYPYQPRVKIALNNMFKNGNISFKTLEQTLEAVSFLILLRGDILKINKSTKDKGLTFVDDETLERLHSLLNYPSPSEIKKEFEIYRGRISRISNMVLEEMLSLAENLKGKNWSTNFKKALSNLSEKEKMNVGDDDNLLKIALIWGASESNQESFLNI